MHENKSSTQKAHQPTKTFCKTYHLADTKKQMTIIPLSGTWIYVSKFVQNQSYAKKKKNSEAHSANLLPLTELKIHKIYNIKRTQICESFINTKHEVDSLFILKKGDLVINKEKNHYLLWADRVQIET